VTVKDPFREHDFILHGKPGGLITQNRTSAILGLFVETLEGCISTVAQMTGFGIREFLRWWVPHKTPPRS